MLKDYTFQPIYSSAVPDNFKSEGGSTQKGGKKKISLIFDTDTRNFSVSEKGCSKQLDPPPPPLDPPALTF